MNVFNIVNRKKFEEATQFYSKYLDDYFNKLDHAKEVYPFAMENQEYIDYVTYHKWPIRQLEYSYIIKNVMKFMDQNIKLLDAGCGVSPMPFLWKKMGAKVTAVDLSDQSIGLMKRMDADDYFNCGNERIRFEQKNIIDLPFENNTFDIIESISVLEHLSYPDYLVALQEFYRVLKPGGLLVCSCDLKADSAKKVGNIGAFSNDDIKGFLSYFRDELQDDCADFENLSITQKEIDDFWNSYWYEGIGYNGSRGYTAVGFSLCKQDGLDRKKDFLLNGDQLLEDVKVISLEYGKIEEELIEKEKEIQLLADIAQKRLQVINELSIAHYSFEMFEHDINRWRSKSDITGENYEWYMNQLREYLGKEGKGNFRIDTTYLHPVVSDRVNCAAHLRYSFWPDVWAASHIQEKRPTIHYDIGSCIDGFIGYMSAIGQKTIQLDNRSVEIELPFISFVRDDVTKLDGIEDGSLESLSALCSLEHFGLGRYGDIIDPDACFKTFDAIQRKIKKGGMLYIAVPVGHEHVEFNAHRVFYANTIINAFDEMELLEYSVSSENCGIEYDVNVNKYDGYMDKGAGKIGLFRFIKY